MPMIGQMYPYKGYEIVQYHQGTLLDGSPGFNSMILKAGEPDRKCCDRMHGWGSFSDVCAERKINEGRLEE